MPLEHRGEREDACARSSSTASTRRALEHRALLGASASRAWRCTESVSVAGRAAEQHRGSSKQPLGRASPRAPPASAASETIGSVGAVLALGVDDDAAAGRATAEEPRRAWRSRTSASSSTAVETTTQSKLRSVMARTASGTSRTTRAAARPSPPRPARRRVTRRVCSGSNSSTGFSARVRHALRRAPRRAGPACRRGRGIVPKWVAAPAPSARMRSVRRAQRHHRQVQQVGECLSRSRASQPPRGRAA